MHKLCAAVSRGLMHQHQALLQVLDRYELKVETKGGYVNFNPELIIITTNYTPDEIFSTVERKHLNALKRRINHYIVFTGPVYQDLFT